MWVDESTWDDTSTWSDTSDYAAPTQTATTQSATNETWKDLIISSIESSKVKVVSTQVTADTTLTDFLPAGCAITAVYAVNAGSDTPVITCGSFSGGGDVFLYVSCAPGVTNISTNIMISATAAGTLYISHTGSAGTVDLYFLTVQIV